MGRGTVRISRAAIWSASNRLAEDLVTRIHPGYGSIPQRAGQPQADCRHERDHDEADEQEAQIGEDRLHGLLDRDAADQAWDRRSTRAAGPSRWSARW